MSEDPQNGSTRRWSRRGFFALFKNSPDKTATKPDSRQPQPEKGQKRKPNLLPRRQFLKLAGGTAVTFALGISGCTTPPEHSADLAEIPSIPVEDISQPEIVQGVEVYGLTSPITTEQQMVSLYRHFDSVYSKTHGVEIDNKHQQRKELLNPNERYLEVVVRRSAYDSFIAKQAETGVDFPQWIKMHVDAMNMCLENAYPPADLKAVLRRIVVVSDDMPNKFWSESDSSDVLGGALDSKWRARYENERPLDTDCSWAIADDSRIDPSAKSGPSYYYSVTDTGENIVFKYPPGSSDPKEAYFYPRQYNSLIGAQNVLLDFGLTHEWLHYLLNLPDEYRMDVHDPLQRFQHFIFDTGSFTKPDFSPFLSYLARRNIELRSRDRSVDGRTYQYAEYPGNINFHTIVSGGNTVNSIEIRRVRLKNDDISTGEKSFPESADQVTQGDQISLDQELLTGNSNCWLVRCNLYGNSREVYVPIAAFIMSSIAGVESANYTIEFSGMDKLDKRSQTVELVPEAELNTLLNKRGAEGDNFYARMKIEGTDIWLVWFLRDNQAVEYTS